MYHKKSFHLIYPLEFKLPEELYGVNVYRYNKKLLKACNFTGRITNRDRLRYKEDLVLAGKYKPSYAIRHFINGRLMRTDSIRYSQSYQSTLYTGKENGGL